MRKKALTLLSLFVLGLGAAACNTIEGVGEDISAVARGGKKVINGKR
jgi:predicted small secreted protein